MAVPTKLISTSQGFQDAKGNVVAGGSLSLTLSQAAEVTASGGLVTTDPLYFTLDVNGKITPTAIWFNDELTPSGTTYHAVLYAANGCRILADFGQWSIAGASSDLSTMVPVATNVSTANAVLLSPSGNQTVSQPSGTNLLVNRFQNAKWVGSGGFSSITAALADLAAGGGTVMVEPNWSETLSANLTISKSNTCIQFMGPATITLGAFSVTMASGINNVSIITPYIHSATSATDGGVTFTGYTGAGAALSFGDSSGFTINLLLRGFTVNLNTGAQANATAVLFTNVVNSAIEYPWITFGGVAGQKGIRLLGTGALFCGLINISGMEFNSSASATNNTGLFVDAITNSVNIYGGHANMGGSANGSTCIDVNGAASSGVICFGFDADVCQTAVKVESTANTGFWGFVRCDSGTTNVANFGAGSQGNTIYTNGNLPFTDSGTAGTNSVINPARFGWRTDKMQWQVESGFALLTNASTGTPFDVWIYGGDRRINADTGANFVKLAWDQGTGGVIFGKGDGATTVAAMSGAGKLTTYNSIATVGNGVPPEVAQVDLTAQTAAVGTTTLYAVPASGAGQYRLSWDAKVTTAGSVSSTLGALTIVYTDPDGNAITITAGALQIGGTVNTTVTTNSVTTAALTGIPLILNCKASTNITYAMAYASNAANTMAYNLHIKLEAM